MKLSNYVKVDKCGYIKATMLAQQ